MWVSLAGVDPRIGGMRGRGIGAVFMGFFCFVFLAAPRGLQD